MRKKDARARRRIPGRATGAILLALAILGSAGFYFQQGKTVTLVVDDEAHQVRSNASTVGDLLGSQGLEIGEHDEITPPPDSALEDGMEVRVLLAKEITLLLNGRMRTLHVTGQTVDDVLEHINLRSANQAYVRPSRSSSIQDGDRIVLREAVRVRVKADRMDKEIITNAPDIGYLLTSLGIIVRKNDRIEPSPNELLTNGLEIEVVRVRSRTVTQREEIPFRTENRRSNKLLKGESRVEREGRPGIREKVFRVRKENGETVNRRLVEERVVQEPQSRIVTVGTRNPNVQQGVASWYDWHGRKGACGTRLEGNYAAHKTLPCGTRVKVTNTANGRSVWVTVRDRGPYVAGRIIDLSDGAYRQLAPLSSGTINVRINW